MRPLIPFAAAIALGAAVFPMVLGLTSPSGPAVAAAAPSAACLTPAVRARLNVATGGAKFRYSYERSGPAAQAALKQIQSDAALTRDLAAGKLGPAQLAADALLVKHIVRIQIALAGGRQIAVNPTSFAVAGAKGPLRASGGRVLGSVEITIQDILGFVKLGHKFTGAQIRVTGRPGHVVSSLPAAVGARLPASGCVTLAGRRYATRTFTETGFAGEAQVVSVLVSA